MYTGSIVIVNVFDVEFSAGISVIKSLEPKKQILNKIYVSMCVAVVFVLFVDSSLV